MDGDILTRVLQNLRSELAKRLGNRLKAVYLYGSHARGDARSDSDIDVLIVIHGEFDYFQTLDQISDIAWELSLKNDVVIAQVLMSDNEFVRGDSPFLMNIHREAVAL